MHIISKILIGLVALIHSYILVLEMFLWESRGPKVFTSFRPTYLNRQRSWPPIRGFIMAFWQRA